MVRRFIVVRKESVHYGEQSEYDMIQRSHFPVLVEVSDPGVLDDRSPGFQEWVVRRAFDQRGWKNYNPINNTYLVFEVSTAHEVAFKPRQDYIVETTPF